MGSIAKLSAQAERRLRGRGRSRLRKARASARRVQSRRGEVTVEKGRAAQRGAQQHLQQAAAGDADEKPAVDVDAMSADEREALLQKLLAKKEAD